jgi:glycosyltransferase involved in cell wall biosynthesis
LTSKLRIKGELPDREYRAELRRAAFVWHPTSIGNGTFSVIEAARSGVPALSSDYPAMREIDEQFGLGLMWMDSQSPSDMARKLKEMELDIEGARARVPSTERLATQSLARLAGAYWDIVREFL